MENWFSGGGPPKIPINNPPPHRLLINLSVFLKIINCTKRSHKTFCLLIQFILPCQLLEPLTYNLSIHLTVFATQTYSLTILQLSVPRIEYPQGDSRIKGIHVFLLVQVFWVILRFSQLELLFDINVVLIPPSWLDVTIVQYDVTILVPWQLSTGSIHDYSFCYCALVGY